MQSDAVAVSDRNLDRWRPPSASKRTAKSTSTKRRRTNDPHKSAAVTERLTDPAQARILPDLCFIVDGRQ